MDDTFFQYRDDNIIGRSLHGSPTHVGSHKCRPEASVLRFTAIIPEVTMKYESYSLWCLVIQLQILTSSWQQKGEKKNIKRWYMRPRTSHYKAPEWFVCRQNTCSCKIMTSKEFVVLFCECVSLLKLTVKLCICWLWIYHLVARLFKLPNTW